MIPGGKKDSQSFGDPKEMNRTHVVTRPPATGMYRNCTIAQYSNIEHGEDVAKVKHIHSHK